MPARQSPNRTASESRELSYTVRINGQADSAFRQRIRAIDYAMNRHRESPTLTVELLPMTGDAIRIDADYVWRHEMAIAETLAVLDDICTGRY